MRKTLGPKRENETGGWRKLNNDALHDLYLLLNKYYLCDQINGMRWTGHLALTGEKESVCRVLLWKPEARNHMEDLDIDRRIVLNVSERVGGGGWHRMDLSRTE